MTSLSPHTAGRAESPRGVRTNGVGIRCVTHLNLSTSLADVDARRAKAKFIKEMSRARQDAREALQVGQ